MEDPWFWHRLTTFDASTTTLDPAVWPSASGTSSWTPPDASCAPFARSLTTTVFGQRSTGWFGACPRRPTPEGLPPSLTQHRLQRSPTSLLLVAFVTHPYDGHRRKPPWTPPVTSRSNSWGGVLSRSKDRSSSPRREPAGQIASPKIAAGRPAEMVRQSSRQHEDEEGEVVLGEPVGDRGREQVELVALGGEEVVGHDVIVAIGPVQVVDLPRALPRPLQIASGVRATGSPVPGITRVRLP